jgi:hypothetical protein
MQGNCLAMSLYSIALMPLVSMMHDEIPDEALQPWYCNDAGAAGKALPNTQCLNFLVKFGPPYGYFPEPSKSYCICKAEDEPAAHQAFKSFVLKITQEGSSTWAASLGAPSGRGSGWGSWSANG